MIEAKSILEIPFLVKDDKASMLLIGAFDHWMVKHQVIMTDIVPKGNMGVLTVYNPVDKEVTIEPDEPWGWMLTVEKGKKKRLQVQTLNQLCHKVRIATTSVSPNLNPRLANVIKGHPEFDSTATGIDPPTNEELSNTTDDQLDNYNITPTIDR